MTASMVTPDNAPRNLEELQALSRAVRYRLALNMGIVQPKTDEEKGFMASTKEAQAATILQSLLARDHGNGAPVARVPAPAPMQPQGMVQPVPMGQPQQMAPPPMAAPPMMAPPMMAPPPMVQVPVHPQQMAPATRQPVTQSDPTNAGAAPQSQPQAAQSGAAAAALIGIQKQMKANHDELVTITNSIKGQMRLTNFNFILLLEIAEQVLGSDKETLVKLLAAVNESGELEGLLANSVGK